MLAEAKSVQARCRTPLLMDGWLDVSVTANQCIQARLHVGNEEVEITKAEQEFQAAKERLGKLLGETLTFDEWAVMYLEK